MLPLSAPPDGGGGAWGSALIVLLFLLLFIPVVKRFREQQGMLDRQRAERMLREQQIDEQQREREAQTGPPDIESIPDEQPDGEEPEGRGGPR